FNEATKIYSEGAAGVARYLAGLLRPATGFDLPVEAGSPLEVDNTVLLAVRERDEGPEGYTMTVTPGRIEIEAASAQGVFYGVQTLRQMLPVEIESVEPVPGAVWEVPALT